MNSTMIAMKHKVPLRRVAADVRRRTAPSSRKSASSRRRLRLMGILRLVFDTVALRARL